ncbi:hypothetical protein GEMRC1_003879 [Eukaryota sp. GEM-RC1]
MNSSPEDCAKSLLFELVNYVAYITVVPSFAERLCSIERVQMSSDHQYPINIACKCMNCFTDVSPDQTLNTFNRSSSSSSLMAVGTSMISFASRPPSAKRRNPDTISFCETPLPFIPVADLPPPLAERIGVLSHLQMKTVQQETRQLRKINKRSIPKESKTKKSLD